jgi:hypothetical protein
VIADIDVAPSCADAGRCSPGGLPDRVDDSPFLYFDFDWRPYRFGHRGGRTIPYSDGDPGEQRALVLERLGNEFAICGTSSQSAVLIG